MVLPSRHRAAAPHQDPGSRLFAGVACNPATIPPAVWDDEVKPAMVSGYEIGLAGRVRYENHLRFCR